MVLLLKRCTGMKRIAKMLVGERRTQLAITKEPCKSGFDQT